MRSRIWPFLALVLVLQQVSDAGRVKRAANTNCQTNPSEMDSEKVVDDADTLSMSCNNDAKVVSCIWRHTDPISEKVRTILLVRALTAIDYDDCFGNGHLKSDRLVMSRVAWRGCVVR